MNVLYALHNDLTFNYFTSKTNENSKHMFIKACDPVCTPTDYMLLLKNMQLVS